MLKQLDIFYHITTPISDKEIERENIKAEAMEKRVWEFFQSNPNKKMIWSDVLQLMGVPIQKQGSVKRSMSHLVRDNKIEKLTSEPLEKSVFGGMSHKHVYRG